MKPSNPSRVLTLERGLQILEYIVERRNVTVTNVATSGDAWSFLNWI